MSGCSQTVRSLFKPDDLVLEKQWLEIRDIFFGDNRAKHDITLALELAAACEHKEARWLTRIFAGKTVSTTEEARDIFLALGENDARGLCFAALLGGSDQDDDSDEEEESVALLRRSAELGCALAQAKMAERTDDEEGFRLATLAALQRERNSFCCLGWCFFYGEGCEKNEDKARENYLIAAELGEVDSMTGVGGLWEESDLLRWYWWGQAAQLGQPYCFLENFSKLVHQFECGSGNALNVFQMGRALTGNVDVEERRIFRNERNFDDRIGPANTAISFYSSQLSDCRRAVDAWSHVGLRFNVVKDIRVLIGKLIWETRESVLFGRLKE
jgi:hypothetical protein